MGKHCQVVLLSGPGAMEYYPKVGFEKANHAFNQSPDPARRKRRVAKGKGNWSVTTA